MTKGSGSGALVAQTLADHVTRVERGTHDGLSLARISPLLPPAGFQDQPLRTMVAFMGLGSFTDEFEIQRFRLLADRLHAVIAVVDTPGLGVGGAQLSRSERIALTSGDFAPTAVRMLGAIRAIFPFHLVGPMHVLGYSMGASLAVDAVTRGPLGAVGQFTTLRSLILIEPASCGVDRSFTQLATRSLREKAADKNYLKRTSAIPGTVSPWKPRRPDRCAPRERSISDQIRLARGLARHDMTGRASLISQTGAQVVIVHGSTSRVARPADLARFTATLRRYKAPVRDLPVEGRHGLWHSLPDVNALAQQVVSDLPV